MIALSIGAAFGLILLFAGFMWAYAYLTRLYYRGRYGSRKPR